MPTQLQQWAQRRSGTGIRPQLPAEISRPITLYVRYTDILTGNVKPIRCVLQNCFPHDTAEEIRRSSGVAIARSSVIHIPHPKENTGREYLDPETWANLSAEEAESGLYWSYDQSLASILPVYVPMEIDFEFQWSTAGGVTTQENNFVRDNRNAFRSIGMDHFMFGSYDMQHHLLRS